MNIEYKGLRPSTAARDLIEKVLSRMVIFVNIRIEKNKGSGMIELYLYTSSDDFNVSFGFSEYRSYINMDTFIGYISALNEHGSGNIYSIASVGVL